MLFQHLQHCTWYYQIGYTALKSIESKQKNFIFLQCNQRKNDLLQVHILQK